MLVFKDEYLLFSGEKCRVVNERYNFWYNGSIYPNVTQIYSRIYRISFYLSNYYPYRSTLRKIKC